MNKKGLATFIDGSPLLMRQLGVEHMKYQSENMIENIMLHHIFSVVYPKEGTAVIRQILSESDASLEGKINSFINFSSNQKLYSKEYLKDMLYALINRGHIILNLEESFEKAQHTTACLIRPTIASITHIDEHYGLRDIFNGEFKIHYVEGDHASILETIEIANILQEICLKLN